MFLTEAEKANKKFFECQVLKKLTNTHLGEVAHNEDMNFVVCAASIDDSYSFPYLWTCA